MYRTGSLRSPSLRREARLFPLSTGHFQPPTRAPPEASAAARRLGPPPQLGVWPVAFAPGQPCSRWSSASPGQAGPVGFRPATRLSRAPHAGACGPPRALFSRAAQEVFRLAPKSRHPVLGPAPATNRNGERRCGRGSAHSEAQISSRNAPADAHGNGVNSALGGGRAEASPAKIKSTEQNRTLCVRMPPLKQRSHNAVFCSPPLSRDRNSHSVSRFRRLPFLSVATAIQD